jgi:hypothetical protein
LRAIGDRTHRPAASARIAKGQSDQSHWEQNGDSGWPTSMPISKDRS